MRFAMFIVGSCNRGLGGREELGIGMKCCGSRFRTLVAGAGAGAGAAG